MTRLTRKWSAGLMLLLAVLTGCSPTQPFYLGEDGDLSHYLDKQQTIDNPDVEQTHSPEVDQARAPITLSNPDFDSLWDLPLQEAVHIALSNTKVIRGGQSPRLSNQIGSPNFISAGTQEGDLNERTAGFASILNPAIQEAGGGGTTGYPSVEQALANFDAQYRMFGSQGNNAIFSTTDRPQNVSDQNSFSGFPTILQLNNGGMISQLTKRSATGTTFTFLNQTDYSAGNQRGNFQLLNSIWTTTLEMGVDQPLLRGNGAQINRIPVVLARIGSDIEIANLERQLQLMVTNVEVRYWDLQKAYRFLETAKVARDTTLTTWQTVYQRYVNGVETAQAEAQARSQYFEFRATVEQALRNLHDNENELRLLMGLAASDGRLIRPIDEPTLARVNFDWNEALAESLVRRPELRSKRWDVQRRELELINARNQLLPQLDVGAFYRFIGVGDDLITSEGRNSRFQFPLDLTDPNNPQSARTLPAQGSSAWQELLDGDYQEFGLRGQFVLNVGMRRELAAVRNAQLQLAREKAFLEDQELDVSHSLAHAVRNLDGQYVLTQTNFNRWVAGDREVKSAEAVYEQGVGTGRQPLDILLDAVRRRGAAQRDYYNALLEYNKSISFVHLRKGSILEYCGVLLEEGPWPQKAYWDALGRARQRDASTYLNYGWSRPSVISRGPAANSYPPMAGPEQLPATQPSPATEEAPADETETPESEPKEEKEMTEMAVKPASFSETSPSPRTGNTLRSGAKTRSPQERRANAQNDAFWGNLPLTGSPASGKTSGE